MAVVFNSVSERRLTIPSMVSTVMRSACQPIKFDPSVTSKCPANNERSLLVVALPIGGVDSDHFVCDDYL